MSIVRWDSFRDAARGLRPPSLLVVHKPKERRVTPMSMLFSRTAIIPVWLVVFVLFALLGSPMTFATGVLLLMVGVVPPAIMLTLWKEPSPTVAEVLHHVHASRTQ